MSKRGNVFPLIDIQLWFALNLLPPQGFGLGVPGVYIQGQRIFVEKVRTVFVRERDLTKLGAHGGLG